MNKFQRIIWTINGILILVVFVFFAIVAFKELGNELSWGSSYDYDNSTIIVGDELEKARKEGRLLQGLKYDMPMEVYGSETRLLPVSVQSLDYAGVTKYDSYDGYDGSNVVNILFLKNDLTVHTTLLDKKGYIRNFQYPAEQDADYPNLPAQDTLQKHITYLISFEDSNKDGRLDYTDHADLYLSNLNGTQLTQVTRQVDVVSFLFVNANEILIKYTERTDEEQPRERFAKYLINEQKLQQLTSVDDALSRMEETLLK